MWRFRHLWKTLSNFWKIIWSVISVLGVIDLIQSQFISKELHNSLPRAYDVISGVFPDWLWQTWVIIILSILIVGLVESTYKKTRRVNQKSDVWVYDAAHYIVTKDWKDEKSVGLGKEIMRLRNEGTTLWRSETNVQTGETKNIKLTPEEEADSIRRTRVEGVNRALAGIMEHAKDGLKIWTCQNDENLLELIPEQFWDRYGFEETGFEKLNLNAASLSPESLKTENKNPPHNKPIYHSLMINKKEVEKIWPSENT